MARILFSGAQLRLLGDESPRPLQAQKLRLEGVCGQERSLMVGALGSFTSICMLQCLVEDLRKLEKKGVN